MSKKYNYVDPTIRRANQQDREELTKKLGIPLAFAAAGAAALVGVMASNAKAPAAPKPEAHTITYLNNDEMETGIQIKPGDTATKIAQVVNGNRLSGQALLDEAKFINDQGSITSEDQDGNVTHTLFAGDTQHPSDVIEAPVMSDQQIADVNSGKLGQ